MAPDRASAGPFTLTLAGQNFGFNPITVFADGFPNGGGDGPFGVAFTKAGGVLVGQAFTTNVYGFATDTDGQHASGATLVNSGNVFLGMIQTADKAHIYGANYSNGSIVELNQDGSLNRVVTSGLPSGLAGLVINPNTGHLLVSDQNSGHIWDVNPTTGAASVFLNEEGDGLSIAGNTLYVAHRGTQAVQGFDLTTKALVFDSGSIAGGIDGNAAGFGALAGKIIVNMNNGTVVMVDIATKSQTTIANGGGRGDFVYVDPNDGSLLLINGLEIDRLSIPGGSFVPPSETATPEPSTLVLACTGLVGLLGYRARRRKATA
jgi:hypothetical protein